MAKGQRGEGDSKCPRPPPHQRWPTCAIPARSLAAAKAPAKKAPAKKAAAKQAAKSTSMSTKIRWQLGERDDKKRAAVTGTSPVAGAEYAITGVGDAWTLTVSVKGKKSLLAEGGHMKCYTAAVRHHVESIAK